MSASFLDGHYVLYIDMITSPLLSPFLLFLSSCYVFTTLNMTHDITVSNMAACGLYDRGSVLNSSAGHLSLPCFKLGEISRSHGHEFEDVFWFVVQFSSVKIERRFRGAWRLKPRTTRLGQKQISCFEVI
jgi:hypothetical protein